MTDPVNDVPTVEDQKSFIVEISYTDTAEATILIDGLSEADVREKISSGIPPTVKDLTFLSVREVTPEEYAEIMSGMFQAKPRVVN